MRQMITPVNSPLFSHSVLQASWRSTHAHRGPVASASFGSARQISPLCFTDSGFNSDSSPDIRRSAPLRNRCVSSSPGCRANTGLHLLEEAWLPILCSKHMAAIGNPEMLTRKIKLWDINAHITCRLCEGYLIDATTVTECLHTFCRSCLVKYLEENNTCPTCRIVIHQSHPLQYIGHDRTMQDIVYKLVPGLQEAELKKQRDFYQKLGMEVPGDIKGELCNMKPHLDSQRNGDVKPEDGANKDGEEKPEEDNDYHRSDEQVSICLECNSSKLRGLKRKWIRCSAQATVLHLKKFIAKKLNLTSFNELDILCNEEILGKDHTLKFVVVTRWRFKKSPLLLHYRPKMDLL
ncbi:polycomb group RING finger protein 3 isoform X1 [Colossoma macropomum]|uniref:polycomb group RING finger protein 3 isoform X1 n=2 Tax=Colossoma macropomum TaxID=42526 RepID=UPI001864BAB9|nr:polycomb group RING finger protein 3 isoform X1 [Colossoma macropomum]